MEVRKVMRRGAVMYAQEGDGFERERASATPSERECSDGRSFYRWVIDGDVHVRQEFAWRCAQADVATRARLMGVVGMF